MASNTYAKSIKEWEEMTATVVANASELPELEIQTAALRGLLEEMKGLLTQQTFRQRRKQEISLRLQALNEGGGKLATVLRVTLKQHYGTRNEKLVEFRLQPFRGRSRKVKPTPPPDDPGGTTVKAARTEPPSTSAE